MYPESSGKLWTPVISGVPHWFMPYGLHIYGLPIHLPFIHIFPPSLDEIDVFFFFYCTDYVTMPAHCNPSMVSKDIWRSEVIKIRQIYLGHVPFSGAKY